ncbi:Oxidoreductase [Aphelenchoides fujianensis]|nr:Oxidoreductase [Aphelenchoides fujianensis]
MSGARGKTAKLNDEYSMPLLGLGTYGIFDQKTADVAVDAALTAGYRLFDTAKFYRNERELGAAFEKYLPKHDLKREEIFIETKANISGADVAESTSRMIEDSLAALRTDYLDLVLVHYPKNWGQSDGSKRNRADRSTAYGVLEDFQDAGKIRSIGVSNFEPQHIDQLLDDGHRLPTVNQCEFHPHLTRPELLDYCRKKGIQFQAHTSLAKHSRSLYAEPDLLAVAKKHGLSVEQTLLGFAYWQQIAVIPKSANPDRIASNLKFLDARLDREDIRRLMELDRFQHYSDCDGWNVR